MAAAAALALALALLVHTADAAGLARLTGAALVSEAGAGAAAAFPGLPGHDYCLLSHAAVHVNVHLEGYWRGGAGGDGGAGVGRTPVAFATGVAVLHGSHSVFLHARSGGAATGRGGPLLRNIIVDGRQVALPPDGALAADDGSMALEAEDATTAAAAGGNTDAEAYLLTLPNVGLSLRLTLRAAPPVLRRRSHSYVHFSVEVVNAKGVLGGISRGILAQFLPAVESESIEPLSRGAAAASDYHTAGALDSDCIVGVFVPEPRPLLPVTPTRSYHELNPEDRAEVDRAIEEAMAAYAVYGRHIAA
eukprot:SM000040S14783  [mRNA]  locus=s40:345903:347266:+ [translate_table: standard]